MPEETVRKTGVKKQRQALLYDTDAAKQAVIRIDLIIEESNNNILTPIPPSYQARFLDSLAEAVARKELEPRSCICHFDIDGTEVERTVYNPYIPSNSTFLQLVKELLIYEGVECVNYEGESIPKHFENLY